MENATQTPKRKLSMKQIYAMRARQAADKAAQEAKAKAARRRGFFIAKARKAKLAAQAA